MQDYSLFDWGYRADDQRHRGIGTPKVSDQFLATV